MNHKLIIFAGACPGVGKSTLSSFLYKQFILAGINSRWFYEEDVADEAFFPGVTEAVTTVDPQVLDILLQSARILVEECSQSESVYITDSLLPFFNWLFAINFDFETIARFSKELELILEPVNPLVVYLDGDIPAAFRRAVAHRGSSYETDFIKYMNEWTYYRAKAITPNSFADIVDFFEKNNQLNLTLLAEWRGPKLIFNTTTTGLDELKQTLLEQLSLIEIAEPVGPDRENLQRFVGSYDKNAEGSIPQTLQVTLPGQDLWVDTYWPDGCRLVAQTATKFQLQDTNYYLIFDISPGEKVNGLTFVIGNKEYSYVKRV